MNKIKLNILVEGQTEETFVRDCLSDYIEDVNSRVEVGYQVLYGVGGVSKIRNHLLNWYKSQSDACFTTMIDFYEFPKDIKGYDAIMAADGVYKRVSLLEKALHDEVGGANPALRLVPYIQLHEFEALLYTDLDAFELFYERWQIDRLRREVRGFATPEHIDGGIQTAPSKRILHHIHDYSKRTAGPRIAANIGIERLRDACRHFDEWLKKLEKLK